MLHHFTDREQCVQAYEASGEAGKKPTVGGYRVDHTYGILWMLSMDHINGS